MMPTAGSAAAYNVWMLQAQMGVSEMRVSLLRKRARLVYQQSVVQRCLRRVTMTRKKTQDEDEGIEEL